VAFIELTRDCKVEVDDEDYHFLVGLKKWYASKCGKSIYAEKRLSDKQMFELNNYLEKNNKNIVLKKILLMHRLIMDAGPGTFVDHIDGNGLNNKKENLRFCSKSQNSQNKSKKTNSYSVYKGVFKLKQKNLKKTWRAYIFDSDVKKRITIGYYETEQDAAIAYNQKAIELYGEFAKLNVI
jgi:hypothetical protein